MKEQSLILRPFEERDRKRIEELYTFAFSSYDGPEFPKRLAALQFKLTPETTLVALEDQLVVGGAMHFPLSEGSDAMDNVEATLQWAREKKDVDGKLMDYCREYQADFGGEIVIDFFDNEFTNGTFPPSQNDLYFDALFVDEKYQGRGIGTTLVKEQMVLARKRDAPAIYVSCVESSSVVNIFKKLHFLPLLRTGPSYANGSAALEMGMRLK